MPRLLDLLRRQAGLLVLLLAAAVVGQHFFFSRAYVEIDCTVDHDTAVELYWAEAGQDYSRSRMGSAVLKLGRSQHGFFLGDLRAIRHFRLDPMARAPGAAVFHSITIRQPGLRPLLFTSPADFARFQPGQNVTSAAFIKDFGWGVTSAAGNPDLHLTVEPPAPLPLADWLPEAGRFIILALLLHLLLRCLAPLAEDFRSIPLLLFGVTLLVAALAVRSSPGSHPDEQVHSAAAAYYERHWLPPAADAPEIAASYSGYGFSRLNSREIAYFLTGKFAWLTEPLRLPAYQRHRLFNVLLLGCLALLAFRSPPARLIFLPLLITPQAWYVFSSCNSDAFALFLCLIAAQQLAAPESLLRRYLSGQSGWRAAVALGLLAGGLLLIKKNFLIFVVFAALFVLLNGLLLRQRLTWPALRRAAALGGIALALFSLQAGADIAANGWNKAAKIQQLREEHAERAYKPSTELAKKHPHLQLRARGVSFGEMLSGSGTYRWGGKALRSFYGVYGHASVAASAAYYELMSWSGWLFCGLAVLTVLLRGGTEERLLLLNLSGCGLLLVGAAAWASWTKDFQPQGRYMLPLLPMLGLLLARTGPLFPPLLLRALFTLMFLLSLCSFLFVGLASPLL
jgi:hypothetical protein